MTTPDSPERDDAVTAAWREHATGGPSPQLDAAILAAAHRAVGSSPRDAATPPREATSPQRWWMPLAAAATIGAVALGILQVVPSEQTVGAPSVSDMPAAKKAAPETAQLQERNAMPRALSEVPPPALPKTALEMGAAALTERKAPMAAPPAPTPAPAVESPTPTPAPAVAAPAPTPAVAAPAPEPQAFPGERKTEAADAAASRSRERDDLRARNFADSPAAPAAAGTVASAKSVARLQGAPQAMPPLPEIDAWIVRIRQMHAEGKLADAAKELIALRAVVADADQRLPAELRAWAATVKP